MPLTGGRSGLVPRLLLLLLLGTGRIGCVPMGRTEQFRFGTEAGYAGGGMMRAGKY